MDNRLVVVDENGVETIVYIPMTSQAPFHACTAPNVLALGNRGGGKSIMLRMDAYLRCLMIPNFHALIVRRTMPELREALALETEIPTPHGWTTMGSLQEGETIFAPDGTPTRVLWKSAVQVDPRGTYRVTFDNGETLVASAGHQWYVSTRMQRRRGTGRVLTTEQIARAVHAEQDQRSNYGVRLANVWQAAPQRLPIDPYVLGVWLGDGTAGQGAVTSYDDEIVDELRRAGYLVCERPAHPKEWSVRGLMVQLRELGVLHDKHVPAQYLHGSPEQRLALLQGLMDTDGWCREDGWCGFSQSEDHRAIAEAVYRLAASLGLKPRWSERPSISGGKHYGISYEIGWSGDVPVFRLSRKRARLKTPSRGTTEWHYIVSCEQMADTPCQCIAVDHPSHQFLVGRASIPTHNSHLKFVDYEMKQLGGTFLKTTFTCEFPNGSTLSFRHCETDADVMNFLSAQYGFIGFDELSTFTLDQFLLIGAAARAPEGAGYQAVIRAVSNPLGIGADWMYDWFVDHTVRPEDYPDYIPGDYVTLSVQMEDNIHLDRERYAARLRNLPEHIRRAWLLGERVTEGMYFGDFMPRKDNRPWHIIHELPRLKGRSILDKQWLGIYRAIDWGYNPDPAVCLWIAVLPSRRAIVFKERTWRKTLAADVAKDIKRESEGMKVVETICDPSMFITTGLTPFSIGEIFEQNGVALRPSENDREDFGYAVHEYLNTLITEGEDQYPQLQILKSTTEDSGLGCPMLLQTLPRARMDPKDPRRIAAGNDHWIVALAYFCMAQAMPIRNSSNPADLPRWMRPKSRRNRSSIISATL